MAVRTGLQHLYSSLFLFVFIGVVTGCAITPSTAIHQPITSRPDASVKVIDSNGGIFRTVYNAQVGSRYIPLFEDRRARSVGDTIIVALNEKTNARKSSGSNIDRSGGIDFSIPTVVGLPIGFLRGTSLEANSNNTFDGKGASSSNNDFTGTITVTVIEVLQNGNLLVSGEKQIGINHGQEFIRLSGIINPINVIGNTVSSVQVADARIEYRANGYLDEAQTMGWLSRFFLTISPF